MGAVNVKPIQTSTYDLNADANPITFETGTDISASYDGVYGGPGAVWNVTNAGSIGATASYGIGISLDDGGSVANQLGATVTGEEAVHIGGGAGTVSNSGTIASYSASGEAIYLGANGTDTGGTVTNDGTGVIKSSGNYAIRVHGDGAVTNFGSISDSSANSNYLGGVAIDGGGTLVNESGATIQSSSSDAVEFSGGAATVTNDGTITDTSPYGFGVLLQDGGLVTNQSQGEITGQVTIVANTGTVVNSGTITGNIDISSAGAAVTNSGTIDGDVLITGANGAVTDSGTIGAPGNSEYSVVSFSGSGTNTLTLQTGAVLNGSATGDASQGGVSQVILQGTGVANGGFQNFTTLDVKASGSWTLGGFSQFGATTVSSGTLIVTNGLTGPITLAGGGAAAVFDTSNEGDVTFQGADALTLSQSYYGVIDGFGTGDTIDLANLKYDASASSDTVNTAGAPGDVSRT